MVLGRCFYGVLGQSLGRLFCFSPYVQYPMYGIEFTKQHNSLAVVSTCDIFSGDLLA